MIVVCLARPSAQFHASSALFIILFSVCLITYSYCTPRDDFDISLPLNRNPIFISGKDDNLNAMLLERAIASGRVLDNDKDFNLLKGTSAIMEDLSEYMVPANSYLKAYQNSRRLSVASCNLSLLSSSTATVWDADTSTSLFGSKTGQSDYVTIKSNNRVSLSIGHSDSALASHLTLRPVSNGDISIKIPARTTLKIAAPLITSTGNCVGLPDNPGTPSISSDSTGLTYMVVSWLSPVNTGNIDLFDYRVTVSQGGVVIKTQTVGLSVVGGAIGLSNLTPGTAYIVEVAARNSRGYGPSVVSPPLFTKFLPTKPPTAAPTSPPTQLPNVIPSPTPAPTPTTPPTPDPCLVIQPPNILSAKLDDTGQSFVVVLDQPSSTLSSTSNALGVLFSCSQVLDPPLVRSLGVTSDKSVPLCKWTSPKILQVSIGVLNPVVRVGDAIGVAPFTVFTAGCVSSGFASNTVELLGPSNAVVSIPVAILSGIQKVGKCDTFEISSSGSYNGFGRNFVKYQWTASGAQNLSAFQAFLLSLPDYTPTLTLTIPQKNQLLLNVGIRQVTVSLVISNFIGKSSDPAQITILLTNDPIPTLQILGPPVITVYRPSNLIISTSLILQPDCSNASDPDTTYTWTLFRSAELTSSSKSVTPIDVSSALSLSTVKSKDLRLPAFSLEPGYLYKVSLKASLTSNSLIYSTADVSVLVSYSTLVAQVSLPDRSSINSGLSIVLDGTSSYNPDYPVVRNNFQYSWSCSRLDPNTLNVLSSKSDCGVTIPARNITVVKAKLFTDLYPVGFFQFTLTVSLLTPDGVYRITSKYVQVDISLTQAPQLTISGPFVIDMIGTLQVIRAPKMSVISSDGRSIQKVDNSYQALYFSVNAKQPFVGGGNINLRWQIQSDTKILSSDLLMYPLLSLGTVEGVASATQGIKAGALYPGLSYTITCFANDAYGQSTNVVFILANDPPSLGLLIPTPSAGSAFVTKFQFEASLFGDVDVPLKYSFDYTDPSTNLVTNFGSLLDSSRISINTLPLGGAVPVTVTVLDSLGGTTKVSTFVNVTAPASSKENLSKFAKDIVGHSISQNIGSKNPSGVTNAVNCMATILNESTASKSSNATVRSEIRKTMLAAVISSTTMAQVESSNTIINTMTTVSTLAAVPGDVDESMRSTMMELTASSAKRLIETSQNTQDAISVTAAIFNVFSNINNAITQNRVTSAGNSTQGIELNKEQQVSMNNIQQQIQSLSSSISSTMKENQAESQVQNSFISMSVKVGSSAGLSSASISAKSSSLNSNSTNPTVTLPTSGVIQSDTAKIQAVYVVFTTNIYSYVSGFTVTSQISSFSISDVTSSQTISISNIPEPISITVVETIKSSVPQACSYFDKSTNSWQTKGVFIAKYDPISGTKVCNSFHLTDFASLESGFHAPQFNIVNPVSDFGLFTEINATNSLIVIVIAVLIFLFFVIHWTLRKNEKMAAYRKARFLLQKAWRAAASNDRRLLRNALRVNRSQQGMSLLASRFCIQLSGKLENQLLIEWLSQSSTLVDLQITFERFGVLSVWDNNDSDPISSALDFHENRGLLFAGDTEGALPVDELSVLFVAIDKASEMVSPTHVGSDFRQMMKHATQIKGNKDILTVYRRLSSVVTTTLWQIRTRHMVTECSTFGNSIMTFLPELGVNLERTCRRYVSILKNSQIDRSSIHHAAVLKSSRLEQLVSMLRQKDPMYRTVKEDFADFDAKSASLVELKKASMSIVCRSDGVIASTLDHFLVSTEGIRDLFMTSVPMGIALGTRLSDLQQSGRCWLRLLESGAIATHKDNDSNVDMESSNLLPIEVFEAMVENAWVFAENGLLPEAKGDFLAALELILLSEDPGALTLKYEIARVVSLQKQTAGDVSMAGDAAITKSSLSYIGKDAHTDISKIAKMEGVDEDVLRELIRLDEVDEFDIFDDEAPIAERIRPRISFWQWAKHMIKWSIAYEHSLFAVFFALNRVDPFSAAQRLTCFFVMVFVQMLVSALMLSSEAFNIFYLLIVATISFGISFPIYFLPKYLFKRIAYLRGDPFLSGREMLLLPYKLFLVFLLCAIVIISSALLCILYGVKFGSSKSEQWMTTFSISFCFKMIFEIFKPVIVRVFFSILSGNTKSLNDQEWQDWWEQKEAQRVMLQQNLATAETLRINQNWDTSASGSGSKSGDNVDLSAVADDDVADNLDFNMDHLDALAHPEIFEAGVLSAKDPADSVVKVKEGRRPSVSLV